jgi:hypothetical protein
MTVVLYGLPLDTVFLVSIWMEEMMYGAYPCYFPRVRMLIAG